MDRRLWGEGVSREKGKATGRKREKGKPPPLVFALDLTRQPDCARTHARHETISRLRLLPPTSDLATHPSTSSPSRPKCVLHSSTAHSKPNILHSNQTHIYYLHILIKLLFPHSKSNIYYVHILIRIKYLLLSCILIKLLFPICIGKRERPPGEKGKRESPRP